MKKRSNVGKSQINEIVPAVFASSLHVVATYFIKLNISTLHYTTSHYITLHYTTLHYTTVHYTTLHYTTLHYAYLSDVPLILDAIKSLIVEPINRSAREHEKIEMRQSKVR